MRFKTETEMMGPFAQQRSSLSWDINVLHPCDGTNSVDILKHRCFQLKLMMTYFQVEDYLIPNKNTSIF